MCGIVGGVTFRDIGPILLQGLRRLEYRGYDSAGVAIINDQVSLDTLKIKGKVHCLSEKFWEHPISGHCGVAHTRWATHGIPSQLNAHPHTSNGTLAVVHNGIIENYDQLKQDLIAKGYEFVSDTDSEVIAHLIHLHLKKTHDLLAAVQSAIKILKGMYAIGVISNSEPDCIIAARSGSPLVVGIGQEENFIASDNLALIHLTHEFLYLEEGDVAKINKEQVTVFDKHKKQVNRTIVHSRLSDQAIDRSKFKHYMEKEIFEQPAAIARILEGRVTQQRVIDTAFGIAAPEIFKKVDNVTLVACGTSYYAAMMGRYWLEEIAGVTSRVEIASEYRYRHTVVNKNTLFVVLSQSGETADTLASFRIAKDQRYLSTLAICNVPESSLVRESELSFLTRAGPEIGVASTKSFITQLCALLLLTVAIGRHHKISQQQETQLVKFLQELPLITDTILSLKDKFQEYARYFVHKEHVIVLGRGNLFPIALEGALKLKEITYLHAEAYPAGELKHGPLAIVDKNMPVIILAPKNSLFEKLKSNMEEVKARGGELFILSDEKNQITEEPGIHVIKLPHVSDILSPMAYVIPLQLLSYYIGVLKGTDVDQPRNLAKSVTVE